MTMRSGKLRDIMNEVVLQRGLNRLFNKLWSKIANRR